MGRQEDRRWDGEMVCRRLGGERGQRRGDSAGKVGKGKD